VKVSSLIDNFVPHKNVAKWFVIIFMNEEIKMTQGVVSSRLLN